LIANIVAGMVVLAFVAAVVMLNWKIAPDGRRRRRR
jgi:hypothetical protein